MHWLLVCVVKIRSFGWFFFFQAEDGIRAHCVTGVQTCALPLWLVNERRVMMKCKHSVSESSGVSGAHY